MSRLIGIGPFMLLLATFIWGGNAVAGRFAVGHVSPMLLTQFRWTIALVILLPIAWPHLRRDWPTMKARAPYLFMMGAIGYAWFNGLLYTATLYTTAINVTVMQAAMPLFIFLLNFLCFRIGTRPLQALGYSLTLVGVLVMASRGSWDVLREIDLNRGDLIMLVGALFYSAYSVGLKSKPELHWLSFLTGLVGCAALAAIPMTAYEWHTGAMIWPFDVQGWAVVAFAAVFPSIVAQASFIKGVEELGGNLAGIYINLLPIWGAILGVGLLGELFAWYHGLAILLVVGGVLLAQMVAATRQPA